MHRVIYDELCLGRRACGSRAAAYVDGDRPARGAGAEGVVLGCTEIELLIKQGDVTLPVFPTTRLHVEAALDAALRPGCSTTRPAAGEAVPAARDPRRGRGRRRASTPRSCGSAVSRSRCCAGSGWSSGRSGRSTSTTGRGSSSAAARSTPATPTPPSRRCSTASRRELRALLDEVRRPRLPVPRRLLRHRRDRHPPGRHRRPGPTASRSAGSLVTLTPRAGRPVAGGPARRRFEAFVGHKEAVRDLPAHAVRLASSPACPVQAFRVGQHVYATQFHPELDIDGLVHPHRRLQARRLLRARPGRDGQGDGAGRPGRRAAEDPPGLRAALRPLTVPPPVADPAGSWQGRREACPCTATDRRSSRSAP